LIIHDTATVKQKMLKTQLITESETWPVEKENKVAPQISKMTMLRWMCDIENFK